MSTSFTKINYSSLVRQAVIDAFKKLNPRDEIKNLVMFVVYGSARSGPPSSLFVGNFSGFNLQICLWLWFTCLFANFAEAMAEGRGKAHADELRKMRTKTMARKLVNGKEVPSPAAS
jgi:K+-transporting ATPase ATPase B chain